jgi:hypothetical protein
MRRAVLLAVLVAAGAAVLSFRPIYEPDLWWHLAQGRENLAGSIVRSNVFSFTYPDYRQQYTPWLFDSSAYLAWRAGGGTGVQLLQLASLSGAFLLLFAACRNRSPAWSAAAVLILGFFLIEPRAIPRPHLLSFAGMAACTLIVERAVLRRSARPLLWSVPLVGLWSNAHVECVFGAALIGIFAVGELLRPSALTRRDAMRALAIAAACTLATGANPYGWGLLAYLYENVSVPQVLRIAELRPPYLPDYRAFFLFLAAGVLALVLQPSRFRVWEGLALVTFGVLGLLHLRLTPLLLFATAPLVASRLSTLAARGIDSRAVLITACAAGLAVSRIPPRLLFTTFEVGTAAVEPRQFFSPGAAAFIDRVGLEGPVFNSQNLGGHLAWTSYPQVRTFQDTRLQAYPPEHFRRIIDASRTQAAWDLLLADVDWAVLSTPRPNQLSGAGRFPSPQWVPVYGDDAVEIVVRREGRYARLIGGN